MWKVKILKGPQTPSTFELKLGDNVIGRSTNCDITIASAGLSKEHAKITVTENGVYVTDLKSTNGTFVNGVQVASQKLKISDKVAFFDVIIGFEQPVMNQLMMPAMPHMPPSMMDGNLALKEMPLGQPQYHIQNNIQNSIPSSQIETLHNKDFLSMAEQYIETVMLPGVYKLGEVVEFKWLIGLFILAFSVVVTTLAVIPMVSITQDSIQIESQRRALSITRSIVSAYERAVQDGTESTFSSRAIEKEPGVQRYYIISSQDGVIQAPPSKAGIRPDDPFVHTARKQDQEVVSQIDSNLIGASVPIKSLDRETGSIRVVSHAVVIYDMGALAVNTDRIISLFVQVLAITLIIGFIVYFFLYKLIEFPIKTINSQIDDGLKNGQTMTSSSYLFPELQNLISNINTALNRIYNPQSNSGSAFTDRTQEAIQLTETFPGGSIAITADKKILAYNNTFSQLVGLSGQQLLNQALETLPDQALILNLNDLLEQSQQSGNLSVRSQLDFNGKFMNLSLVPIFDEKGVRYYFIGFMPEGGF